MVHQTLSQACISFSRALQLYTMSSRMSAREATDRLTLTMSLAGLPRTTPTRMDLIHKLTAYTTIPQHQQPRPLATKSSRTSSQPPRHQSLVGLFTGAFASHASDTLPQELHDLKNSQSGLHPSWPDAPMTAPPAQSGGYGHDAPRSASSPAPRTSLTRNSRRPGYISPGKESQSLPSHSRHSRTNVS
jgi:hypothetical protein